MDKKFGVVLIGAGNLATNLGKALTRNGFTITQVYSRTEKSAKELAQTLGVNYTTNLAELNPNEKLYIISLRDDALLQLLPEIMKGKENSIVVHTAGSIPLSLLKSYSNRVGVFYPMQTFSKLQEVAFDTVPIFIEAIEQADCSFLMELAREISTKVYHATSDQRTKLHLAAVFASNFSNHMYALSAEILKKYDLPLDAMNSLIAETTKKALVIDPLLGQTGPAVRCDYDVMNNHIDMLVDLPDYQELYKQISKSIIKHKLD